MDINELYEKRKEQRAEAGKFTFFEDARKLFKDDKAARYALSLFEMIAIYGINTNKTKKELTPEDYAKKTKELDASVKELTKKLVKQVALKKEAMKTFNKGALKKDPFEILATNALASFFISSLANKPDESKKEEKPNISIFCNYMVELKLLFEKFEIEYA